VIFFYLIERKYGEDPGPDFITADVPLGSLQLTISEVNSGFG
jgi:hypothetical protein